MLTSLSIENFAIVSKLELDFSQGMTAFTGETGAGKSIMIDALMLALGGRADSSCVRPETDKCDIHACFMFDDDSKPHAWLVEHELDTSEKIIYLRRVIHQEGRSKSFINGQPFPLQKLKELSALLVDIHGQHQHQSLLQHPTHRSQLDAYANHPSLSYEVYQSFQSLQKLRQKIADLREKSNPSERIELLKFQIEELSTLNLQDNEFEALSQEHHTLHHAKEYLEKSQNIHQLIRADEGPDITQGLHQVMQILETLPKDLNSIHSARELINAALIQCEEAYSEIHDFAEKVQLDPERLQDVETRMSELHHAARKYQQEPNQLNSHLQTLLDELKSLENREQELSALEEHYQQAHNTYLQHVHNLRDSRDKAAPKLTKQISLTIQKLGMPHGFIQIQRTPIETFHAHGMDKIEYLVCTNPGMKPDVLSKVASGGELSRISLAIQMATAEKGSTPTLLFDEVDVGIGGQTAALVGEMLHQLGSKLQIFCVTHQPQVAAKAHHHFVVSKHTENKQTFSQVKSLTEDQKVEEIARMLGGITVTDKTRSHAKELLS